MSAASLVALLAEGRRREKAQTLFYRALAARAEDAGDAASSEALNELHADEQHHLSRLTARLLELGGQPAPLQDVAPPAVPPGAWDADARRREGEEVAWYQDALESPMDDATRNVLVEILESERRHHAELRGKWMRA